MLVKHLTLSIQETEYPAVHVNEWQQIGNYLKLTAGREKDASDDLLIKRRGAWNRLTANRFWSGDWGIVCEWVKEVLYYLDAESRLLIEEQGDAVSEVMLGVIKERHQTWERFQEKVELSMIGGL